MKNLTLCVLAIVLFLQSSVSFASVTDHPFTDFEDALHFETAANGLYDLGILNGYEDGSFGFNNEINRAEFLKIVLEAAQYDGILDGEISGNDCYKDVQDQWFASYICKATDMNLVDGYDDGYFRPEQTINLAEASKIIINTFGIETDDQLNANWYHKFLVALSLKRAIPVTLFSPYDLLDRSEMAEMIFIIITYYTPESFIAYEVEGDVELFIQEIPIGFVNSIPPLPLEILETLDSKTFETVYPEYDDFAVYLDKNGVYSFKDGDFQKLEIADPETFELKFDETNCEPLLFFADKNNLYNEDLLIIEGADPETIDTYDGGGCSSFLKDENNIYYYRNDKSPHLFILEGADPDTFGMYDDLYDDQPTHDEHSIFTYDETQDKLIKIPNFDLTEAEWIDYPYIHIFKYKNKIYAYNRETYNLEKFEGIDAATFVERESREPGSLYEDKDNVYFLRTPDFVPTVAEGVDRDTFDMIDYDTRNFAIFKDKDHIYYSNDETEGLVLFEEVDYDTFELEGGSHHGFFVKDKDYVYSMLSGKTFVILPEFDSATFEFTQNNGFAYAMDKNAFYYIDNGEFIELEGADPGALTILSKSSGNYYYYLYDQNDIWFYEAGDDKIEKLEGEDPATFDFEQKIK
jgi:hypothetical protein